ncbi:hypothetical protein CB1_000678038 [Camelus ferus]|nr:hypothetical protein CB1_000678038 [Camelus ferus]
MLATYFPEFPVLLLKELQGLRFPKTADDQLHELSRHAFPPQQCDVVSACADISPLTDPEATGASAGDAEAQGGPGPRLPFAVAALRKRVVFDIKYCGQTRSKRIILDSVRRIIQNRILIVILAVVLVITILMAITFSVRRH